LCWNIKNVLYNELFAYICGSLDHNKAAVYFINTWHLIPMFISGIYHTENQANNKYISFLFTWMFHQMFLLVYKINFVIPANFMLLIFLNIYILLVIKTMSSDQFCGSLSILWKWSNMTFSLFCEVIIILFNHVQILTNSWK
jgi:hypothetical protein